MTVLLSANRLDRHLVEVRFPSSEKYVRGYWTLKVRGFALWFQPGILPGDHTSGMFLAP